MLKGIHLLKRLFLQMVFTSTYNVNNPVRCYRGKKTALKKIRQPVLWDKCWTKCTVNSDNCLGEDIWAASPSSLHPHSPKSVWVCNAIRNAFIVILSLQKCFPQFKDPQWHKNILSQLVQQGWTARCPWMQYAHTRRFLLFFSPCGEKYTLSKTSFRSEATPMNTPLIAYQRRELIFLQEPFLLTIRRNLRKYGIWVDCKKISSTWLGTKMINIGRGSSRTDLVNSEHVPKTGVLRQKVSRDGSGKRSDHPGHSIWWFN